MAADPLAPVSPGDPIPDRAVTWNPILASARAFRANKRRGQGGNSTHPRPPVPAHVVTVHNNSGGDLDIFSVVELTDTIESLTDDYLILSTRPAFDAIAPTGADIPFGVLLDPIADGALGRCVVGGCTVAKVDIADPGHEYAVPATGNSANLVSAAVGPVRIVAREAGTSGVKYAAVLIGGGGVTVTGDVTNNYNTYNVDGLLVTGNATAAGTGTNADEVTDYLRGVPSTGVEIRTDGTTGERTVHGIDADVSQTGVVSTDAQSMSGDKEFIDRFRFGLNYVTDGPRTGSPHEGHDGIGEAFAFGWNGGSDRYMNIFKGGVEADGDSPGKLKVWNRIEAVLRYICNGKDGETGATTNGYSPVFEGGIKVDEVADQPTYYNGVSTTAHAPGTSWAVVGGLFGTGGGWNFSGVWPVRVSIMFMMHTDFVSEFGGAADVIVKMRLTKSTDGGTTWNYVTDTEFNVVYVVDGAGKAFPFVCYSAIVPPAAAYRLRPEMIRDAVGGGDSLTCQFTNNYSTFALNEIR